MSVRIAIKNNLYLGGDLTDKEFTKAVSDITDILNQFEDEELVDEFEAYGEGNDYDYVRIIKLKPQ